MVIESRFLRLFVNLVMYLVSRRSMYEEFN